MYFKFKAKGMHHIHDGYFVSLRIFNMHARLKVNDGTIDGTTLAPRILRKYSTILVIIITHKSSVCLLTSFPGIGKVVDCIHIIWYYLAYKHSKVLKY